MYLFIPDLVLNLLFHTQILPFVVAHLVNIFDIRFTSCSFSYTNHFSSLTEDLYGIEQRQSNVQFRVKE